MLINYTVSIKKNELLMSFFLLIRLNIFFISTKQTNFETFMHFSFYRYLLLLIKPDNNQFP